MSFSFWFKPTSGNTLDNVLCLGDGLKIRYDSPNTLEFAATWNSLGAYTEQTHSISSIVEDSWNHIIITYDATDRNNNPTFYLNSVSQSVTLFAGTRRTSYSGIYTLSDSTCTIGNNKGSLSANQFKGEAAEFAIWNRILTPGEVTEIYNAGIFESLSKVASSTKADLQLWYKLGGSSDIRVKFYDESGNGKHSISTNGIDFSNYIDETKPSYHKTFKNTAYRMLENGTIASPLLKETHNNAYIGTPIPASDYQYSWIDSSLRTEYGIDSGQQNHYRYSPVDGILSSSSGYVEAIIFPSSSTIT